MVVANKCDVRRIAELPEDGQVSRSGASLSARSQNRGEKQESRLSVFPVTVEAMSLVDSQTRRCKDGVSGCI